MPSHVTTSRHRFPQARTAAPRVIAAEVAALLLASALVAPLAAQQSVARPTSDTTTGDSLAARTVAGVRITADVATPRRPLPQVTRSAIYAGKKTESIEVGALSANLVRSNTRQLFASAPGVFVWEQDAGGIQAGIATRGLSPNRSWEFNTRQNGVDIASDPFGYPEAYYAPPFEALERVEIVRGSASLQFGPQFGGLLNYVVKSAPEHRALAIESSQAAGSYGLLSSYNALGGTVGRVSYYGYLDARRGGAWRPNADFSQYTGFLRAAVALPRIGRLGVELTRMDYDMRQPGGLTEEQYRRDPAQGLRARDWFGAPWTIPVITWDADLSRATHLSVKAFGLVGARNSIGVITATTVRDTLLNPRRVDRDRYGNVGAEARLVREFVTRRGEGALASGVRASRGVTTRRRAAGVGGDAFDVTFAAPPSLDLRFTTRNLATFAEVKFPLSARLSITPGLRVEHLTASGTGSWQGANASFRATGMPTRVNEERSETRPLAGLGLSWHRGRAVEVYGNVAQAFRPALFSDQFQTDNVAVDPALHSAHGFSTDVGARGEAGAVRYDVGAFYMLYEGRVGVLNRAALGVDSLRYPNGIRRNVGTSRHYGVESFFEADVLRLAGLAPHAARVGTLSLFSSIAGTVAEYVRGPVSGKEVEYAPDLVARHGATYRLRDRLTASLQVSHVDAVFSDASNTEFQANGQQGRIPAYRVWDASASVRLVAGVFAQASVNNLADRVYFTRRASGFPGPGIVPADRRTLTAGLRAGF